MALAKLRVGVVGVEIRVPLTDEKGRIVDLSMATVLTLYLQKPNGTTTVSKVASKVGSGSTGILTYTTVAGDIDVAGEWKAQARVQYTTPLRDFWSVIMPLPVQGNLG